MEEPLLSQGNEVLAGQGLKLSPVVAGQSLPADITPSQAAWRQFYPSPDRLSP